MHHTLAPRYPSTSLRALALASALCCATLAQAQNGPGVTLYGMADVGITSTTGLKAGTVTQIASGIMEGSRWGLKGNEDLGGGYKTIFTLESRVELDTGASANRPISGSQLSDKYSQAVLMGIPSALQPAVDGVDAALANEFGEAADFHLSTLFALGFLLFVITFVVLAIAKVMLLRSEKAKGA